MKTVPPRSLARRLLLVLALAVCATATFLAGVLLAPALRPALLAVAPTPSPPSDQTLNPFWEVWRLIEREYYGAPPDKQALVGGAIHGLVNALGDPHSSFMTTDDVTAMEQEIAGDLQSIGMAVEKRDDMLTVIAPLSSSPAQVAGVRSGDRIARIDGRDTALLTLGEAVRLLHGPPGSTVTLTIWRGDGAVDLIVQRGAAPIALFSAYALSESYHYVNIRAFSPTVARDLAAYLRQSGAGAGIVLDLRNNPGGYLDVAVEVAGQFIGEGIVVTQLTRGGAVSWSYSDGGRTLLVAGPEGRQQTAVRYEPLALDVPVVVLINRGTASAAEVLASALAEQRQAVLLGEHTYGKSAVSGDYRLSDGSLLHLSNGRWLTPRGRSVDSAGLSPTVVSAAADSLIQQALDLLQAKR